MSYVNDAFDNLKAHLEITQTESELAKRRHREIRDFLEQELELTTTFLTGSYRRHTKTKPLKDVDIFCVIDPAGGDADLRDLSPTDALHSLKDILSSAYDRLDVGWHCCTIHFGPTEKVVSFDVVPAFEHAEASYEIPSRRTGDWIRTDPEIHRQLVTDKNAECGEKFVPLVKMVKGLNVEIGKPVRPSFLLEVMAFDLVKPPVGRYQDEVRWLLASTADEIGRAWPDPARLGPDIDHSLTHTDKQAAQEALRVALGTAEEAIRLEDAGREHAAVEAWRELFGNRMPRP